MNTAALIRASILILAAGAAASVSAQVLGTDLSITKSAAATGSVGSNITYTIVASNLGPLTANGVAVTDSLPAGTAFVSATSTQGTCSGTATVMCSVGTLLAGGSATITIVAQATAAGSITNSATVTPTTDSNPANNTASATTNVAAAVPTLSWTGLVGLAILLGGLSVFLARRDSRATA